MLPVLCLEINKNELCLDMCAAPGSKSGQYLELIMSKNLNVSDKGGLIANELDQKRAFILAHQLARFNSCNFVITNNNVLDIDLDNSFDKIICDVPCSGDGAIRKLPDRVKRWSPLDSCSYHNTQCDILTKAIDLLKVNGVVVYSTCSINSIENEAVVQEVIRRFPGSLELLDVHKYMPYIKTNKGLKKWLNNKECTSLSR